MFSEQFKQVLQFTSVVIVGLLSGAGIALILMKYPGSFEFRLNSEEGYIKLDGRPECVLIAETEESQQ